MTSGGSAPIRFSYCMVPDYPMADQFEMIKVADECGFYACYATDEIYHKDLWTMFAGGAHQTQNIRFAPSGPHVFLREPTLIAQQVATLDEITGHPAEAVISPGNMEIMKQYHI